MPKRTREINIAKEMFESGMLKVKKPKLASPVAEKTTATKKKKKPVVAKKKTPAVSRKKETITRDDTEDEEESDVIMMEKPEDPPHDVIQLTESTDELPQEELPQEEQGQQQQQQQDDFLAERNQRNSRIAVTPRPAKETPPVVPRQEEPLPPVQPRIAVPPRPAEEPPVVEPVLPPVARQNTPPVSRKQPEGNRLTFARTKENELKSPVLQVPPQPNRYFSPGLNVVQESLEEQEALPQNIVEEEEATPQQLPKESRFELFFPIFTMLVAVVAIGFATMYPVTLSVPEIVKTMTLPACPPGGYCENGVLKDCGEYLEMVDGRCILEEAAAAKVNMIERLLHKYSVEHIREAENPYFARVEHGRPLYYLASVADALQIQHADVELLYAANNNNKKKTFLISDGFLVGIHPDTPIQGSWYAHLQVMIRTVVAAVTFFVWSVLVSLFAIYSSWYKANKLVTVVTTIVVVFVLTLSRQFYLRRRAMQEKERQVVKYRSLVFHELYKTSKPVSPDIVFARVAADAFPSSSRKREALKASVWRHIVRDARGDDRIRENDDGLWEWVDPVPPTIIHHF